MPPPLPGSGDERTRRDVVRALGDTRFSGAVAALESLGAGKDGRMRKEAADALADLSGEEARAARVRALSNHDPEVRYRAAHGLGEGER